MTKGKGKKAPKGKGSTGSLKGFILLVLLIGVALWAYEHRQQASGLLQGKELQQEWAGKLKEVKTEVTETGRQLSGKVGEALKEKTSTATVQSGTAGSINRLEIPVLTRKREEIRLERLGYSLSYNSHYKTPNWVAWELTRKEVQGKEERKDKFVPDPDLPEPRVVHADYTGSGYDRGHMAPAADMKWSKQAMQESFYMSNICPQNQKLNRDDWGDLEEICRKWAKKYGTVHIACGPIYDQKNPKRIGKNRVAVPDRFYKVVLIYNRKNPIAMGFLFDNKAHHQAISKYMVSVDSVESVTGMDFFSRLPDEVENRIEALVPSMPSY